jgi:two-component system chemotaxis response regulator CheB
VWGMPGYVAEAGLADAVLPLDRLALAIVRRARDGRPARQVPGGRAVLL